MPHTHFFEAHCVIIFYINQEKHATSITLGRSVKKYET